MVTRKSNSYSQDTGRIYAGYLEEAKEQYLKEHPLFLVGSEGGKVVVHLNEGFDDFLKGKEFDHDCTASSDDGCAVCGMLQELGILPDGQEYTGEESL